MSWRGTVTSRDRFFACLPYLLPLISALSFGIFLFRQFPALGIIFIPLAPILTLYSAIPFASFIIFIALFMGVVRNENIPHFIRFNTMQAILLDILLALFQIIFSVFTNVPGTVFLIETLFNVIFLGAIAAIVYSVIQSILGRYAEIPTLSDAVHMQVR